MKFKFENGFAQGFAFAVPECFRNSLKTGQFSEGDIFYRKKSVYEKIWSEALKDFEYSIEVCGVSNNQVKYKLLAPNLRTGNRKNTRQMSEKKN